MTGASEIDVAVIGAGPAGMAAAAALRRQDATVAVFDENPAPGGQIYRNVEANRSNGIGRILGADYLAGLELVDTFRECGASYHPRASVWRIDADGISWSSPDGGGECRPRRVILATGAMERPFPLKGWTLPGVMTAGAAQILLKTSGSAAEGAVFVGCGPLFYLVIHQYLEAGVPITAVFDTTPAHNRAAALPHLPRALAAPGYLWKGLKLLAALRRSGVTVHRGVDELRFEGTERLEAVVWCDQAGDHRIECGTAFVHQGIIPNPNAAMAAGCAHRWNARQLSWQPVTGEAGRTDVEWLSVAGDAAGIGGAKAAAMSGELAALGVAKDLSIIDDGAHDRLAAGIAGRLRRDLAARPFLDVLYRPRDSHRRPVDDSIIVCRCEEVTRGMVAAAAAEGCPGPNQLKSFTRAGMGPCQGRLCGHTISETLADLGGREPSATGYYRIRMPIKPVTLGEIADMPTTREKHR